MVQPQQVPVRTDVAQQCCTVVPTVGVWAPSVGHASEAQYAVLAGSTAPHRLHIAATVPLALAVLLLPRLLMPLLPMCRGEGSFGILAYGSCGYTNDGGALPFPRAQVRERCVFAPLMKGAHYVK